MATATEPDYEQQNRDELYERAQERDIPGRSEMTKDELVEALRRDDIGPDAVALLLEQHDAIRDLFARFGDLPAGPSDEKEAVVGELVTLLVQHAEIEEQVFYPAVRTELPGLADEADEGLEEHHASEYLLSELDGADSDGERYDAKVHVMIEHMRHHLEEEEEDMFATVRELMPEERRRSLGAAMVRQWDVAATRPHPRTPQTPPANVLLTLPTATWDLTVRSVRALARSLRRAVRR